MDIFFENKTEIPSPLSGDEIDKIVSLVLEATDRDASEDWELSVILVSREEIRKVNREYRNIDRATDVISFAFSDGEGAEYAPYLLGDLIISPEIVKNHSEKYGVSIEHELSFMIVHGVLHLLGFDHIDKKERELMREKEKHIMETAGLSI